MASWTEQQQAAACSSTLTTFLELSLLSGATIQPGVILHGHCQSSNTGANLASRTACNAHRQNWLSIRPGQLLSFTSHTSRQKELMQAGNACRPHQVHLKPGNDLLCGSVPDFTALYRPTSTPIALPPCTAQGVAAPPPVAGKGLAAGAIAGKHSLLMPDESLDCCLLIDLGDTRQSIEQPSFVLPVPGSCFAECMAEPC